MIFYDVFGEGGKVQIMANAKFFPSVAEFIELNDNLKRGDIIGCVGNPGRFQYKILSNF